MKFYILKERPINLIEGETEFCDYGVSNIGDDAPVCEGCGKIAGVDVSKINSMSGTLNNFKEPIYGYTNYELWLIKNNPEFLKKTIFYLNGKVIPSPF